MRVKVFASDVHAVSQYRAIWPATQLQRAGHDVRIIAPAGDTGSHRPGGLRATVDPHTGQLRAVQPPDCDVAVFQLPMTSILPDVFPLYQAMGVACVVEVDDDYTSLDGRNAAFTAHHPRKNRDYNWLHLARAARVADLVTCTTPQLARVYAPHGRFEVLPNFIPERYLKIPHRPAGKRPPVVGWAGSLSVHTGDLDVTRGAVGQVVADTRARFRLLGDMDERDKIQTALRLRDLPDCTGWSTLEQYPQNLAGLDVGIVPLADTRFNQSKSWLKGLEMSACGGAVVASDTEPYRLLEQAGMCTVARKPSDWKRALRPLLTDRALREDRAAAAREAAAEYTIEANAWRWWRAWEVALKRRRSDPARIRPTG